MKSEMVNIEMDADAPKTQTDDLEKVGSLGSDHEDQKSGSSVLSNPYIQ